MAASLVSKSWNLVTDCSISKADAKLLSPTTEGGGWGCRDCQRQARVGGFLGTAKVTRGRVPIGRDRSMDSRRDDERNRIIIRISTSRNPEL